MRIEILAMLLILGEIFYLSLLSIILVAEFCEIFYQVEEICFYSWFVESFYYSWVLNFVKCFSHVCFISLFYFNIMEAFPG